MAKNIDLKFSHKGTWLVAHIEGVITLETREELRQRVESELDKQPAMDLVLDLAEVSAIDSSGLGSVFSIYKILNERKAKLALAAPRRDVAALLELTHLDKVIRIVKSVVEITG